MKIHSIIIYEPRDWIIPLFSTPALMINIEPMVTVAELENPDIASTGLTPVQNLVKTKITGIERAIMSIRMGSMINIIIKNIKSNIIKIIPGSIYYPPIYTC